MTELEAQQIISQIVPRETFEKLNQYVNLLLDWQTRFNLVSRGTISQIWVRHILDSLQLKNYLPDINAKIADIGSGAGFPGLVLAILGYKINLIDSNNKKVKFLTEVNERLNLDVKIIHTRCEDQKFREIDIFTSRAVANLNQLLIWVYPSMQRDTTAIFMKGRSYQSELSIAQQYWNFDYTLYESLTQKDSMILMIKNLSKKRY